LPAHPPAGRRGAARRGPLARRDPRGERPLGGDPGELRRDDRPAGIGRAFGCGAGGAAPGGRCAPRGEAFRPRDRRGAWRAAGCARPTQGPHMTGIPASPPPPPERRASDRPRASDRSARVLAVTALVAVGLTAWLAWDARQTVNEMQSTAGGRLAELGA